MESTTGIQTEGRLYEEFLETKAQLESHERSLQIKDCHLRLVSTRLGESEAERRTLNERLQELKGSLRVFCRVKPLSP